MEETMASFTERLRELRTQNNYSQQDLADKMGVTKQTISQYERGVRKPDMDTLTALCDIFNVSSDYLMGKSDVTVRLLNTDDLRRLNSSHQDQSNIAAHFDGDEFTQEEWEEIERFKMFVKSKRDQ